jgi:hypothetical protein
LAAAPHLGAQLRADRLRSEGKNLGELELTPPRTGWYQFTLVPMSAVVVDNQ